MTYTAITSINFTGGIVPLFQYANYASEGWLINGFLIVIFIGFTFGYTHFKKDLFGGIAIGGFMTWIFGLLFLMAELSNKITYGICIAVFIISAIGLFLRRQD